MSVVFGNSQPTATIKQLGFGYGWPCMILLSSLDQNQNVIGIDPTAGAGVDAPVGSLGIYTDATNGGRLYLKTGAATTAWTLK